METDAPSGVGSAVLSNLAQDRKQVQMTKQRQQTPEPHSQKLVHGLTLPLFAMSYSTDEHR
ncbi:hypothetical protein K437DRAFT_259280 [Tilletiaria anomala UBC 951]|uniref:Uncharacterized protein n=1 Tax=Tilletiaria anomala (strain ATCC 24038 / CBS 436.72 / UBC 951) TaxID=1037660 RepID=A0A066VBE5_TILAU|nr:uncharacterized protein K437DRAFT_259280 [Tilletiaria anomala UBC 951]KDN38781.1 hypothetical protein K437DRAFT_259280 [Tilletiaria anomala UBC 951]